MSIHPVVLSGGSGTRLWPLSREALPKQFLKFHGDHSLLQGTILRTIGLTDSRAPTILANNEHRFLIAQQLQEIGVAARDIILEPVARNTAPPLAIAALSILDQDPSGLMLVLPSDHLITDGAAFRSEVLAAVPAALAGHLVTFGIRPRWAETGYGYIACGDSLPGDGACRTVSRFVEKPDLARAERFVAEGSYLWNSGMFLFPASVFVSELERLQPGMLAACRQALSEGQRDLDFTRLSQTAFERCPSISVDYAVLEHTPLAVVRPVDYDWSDLGSWKALWDVGAKDADGNVTVGETVLEDVRNSYLYSENRLVTAIGVEGIVVIETADAILVSHRDSVQAVRRIVDKLKDQKRTEGLVHRKVHRPWGTYESVDEGDRFQVKRITVNPGSKLSLQMHHHRAEHWIVVRGTARVTRGEDVVMLGENESTYIPLGVKHRLENPGRIPLELIEVQSGTYLGEDDIVRFEDTYNRG
ncbi:MAG: mannose-1-phosphate guanylyltransferase/mannose-6-phosphate isomerase [Rhodocyclaceae bacterium]|jgi:mannose-1-phosphate guanylyltransferase/mannose-6-phosphate isomerase|nr:mannose-1-phosphate guanylyltransferase/mannose-6-phosphate isomerase [Rhodocyclaceae bacterium]MCE2981785.1 mannose-1-phosphate guanylyltransferase/mannose-6-phosphate isomerase [Betaproteobacteria bacterium]MCA3098971.1 mannose-1-phosphate guanylyltransferase/mannose-6-phosphate isomerase [Rhodocyclaceae bacterium]MCA3119904.1 mannose-1-phosphate guanylyltransferase/mannose-6-phosphate isomerase [Rhodocyclaceae bacterium]MCA3123563.1 mannose-1-phosphate guanylyltransferase/mannose-6-phosph